MKKKHEKKKELLILGNVSLEYKHFPKRNI